MAIFQGEITLAFGYGVNTLSKLQSETITSIGYARHTTFLITGGVNNSLSQSTDALSLIKGVNALPFSNYHPYQSRFARFFGVGARQDASKLYIQKADLGLALAANNTAESILVALLLQVLKYESNSLLSDVYIYIFQQYFETVSQPIAVSNLVINLNNKIVYTLREPQFLGGVMTNYRTVVNPDDFKV